MEKEISKATLKRLPTYLAYLKSLPEGSSVNISATALAAGLHMGEVQVRKDLAAVSSQPGKPRVGFCVHGLIEDIQHFLGYDNANVAVLVGAGHLGQALLSYGEFAHYGLKIAAAFDNNPDLQGSSIHGCPVYGMDMLPIVCQQNSIPIGIITNDEITVSVCYHSSEMIPDFIQHTRRKQIQVPNKYELILRLIYSSAVWFLKYLKQINNEVSSAEKELERSIRNEDLLRLMNLQKSLVYFNTSIRGNEVMISKFQNIFETKDRENKELTEDVLIELKQARNMVNIYSDILTGTMDAFASIISNNVNTIMRRMTTLSIVLMVPTLIASFYGMNVDIHLEHVPHAFSLIICLSVVLSAMAFIIFRKIKWF